MGTWTEFHSSFVGVQSVSESHTRIMFGEGRLILCYVLQCIQSVIIFPTMHEGLSSGLPPPVSSPVCAIDLVL